MSLLSEKSVSFPDKNNVGGIIIIWFLSKLLMQNTSINDLSVQILIDNKIN